MIVSGAHRYIYVCIPKTGTGSMRRHLMAHYQGRSSGAYHQTHCQHPGPNWCVFTTVRNPYTRLVSWWWFTAVSRIETRPPEEREFWQGAPLSKFIRFLIERRDGYDIPNGDQKLMRLPQHEFLRYSNPTHIVRLEHLMDEFNALPWVKVPSEPIQKFRRSSERGKGWRIDGRDWTHYYDQETLDLANEYGAADEAVAFGYRLITRIDRAREDGQSDPAPIGPVVWPDGGLHREWA